MYISFTSKNFAALSSGILSTYERLNNTANNNKHKYIVAKELFNSECEPILITLVQWVCIYILFMNL